MPWPFSSPAPPSSTPKRWISEVDPEENDGYHDVEEDVTGLSPSANREMKQFLKSQQAAEHTPYPNPAIVSGSSKHTRSKLAYTKNINSMDSDILNDPVKANEAREIANNSDHSHRARKHRLKYGEATTLEGVGDIVTYTDDAVEDQLDEDYEARRDWPERCKYG